MINSQQSAVVASQVNQHQQHKKILVTSALAYANGPLHLGHILEYIQTDIWVRFCRMCGHDCRYISGDDAHGAPIMLSARKRGIVPEQLVSEYFVAHQQDAAGFQVAFDYYGSTNAPANRQFTNLIYQRLLAQQDINAVQIEQAYDPQAQMFLPDRFIKGECPRCHAPDQYGDNCEQCGATYTPLELLHPYSALTGTTPATKQSTHYFFNLPRYTQWLQGWCVDKVSSVILHKLEEWFSQGLRAWDISRDAPYFGFAIPDIAQKYFYVWLDAPIGYISITQLMCDQLGLDFQQYWPGANEDTTATQSNATTGEEEEAARAELYHFIGKDIVYFHALFWPAILKSSGIRQPDAIFVHGYLTINGQKMSKSRGTFILAQRYLAHLAPEYLRYYFAAKLNASCDDIDLNLEDFVQRNNSDLVGKVINIASRCAGFITKYFNGWLAERLPATADLNGEESSLLFSAGVECGEVVAQHYLNRNYSSAIRQIMYLADRVNRYIDSAKPWALAKNNPQDPAIQLIATVGLNLYRQLAIMLQPVLPSIAARSREMFQETGEWDWMALRTPLLQRQIAPFKPLLQRVEMAQVQALLADAI